MSDLTYDQATADTAFVAWLSEYDDLWTSLHSGEIVALYASYLAGKATASSEQRKQSLEKGETVAEVSADSRETRCETTTQRQQGDTWQGSR